MGGLARCFCLTSVALGPEFLSSDPRLSALTTRGRSYGTPLDFDRIRSLSGEPHLVRVFLLLICIYTSVVFYFGGIPCYMHIGCSLLVRRGVSCGNPHPSGRDCIAPVASWTCCREGMGRVEIPYLFTGLIVRVWVQ